jgi:LPS sulfotransferase NodH
MSSERKPYTATYILSTGRSGTTVLARALGGHPGILVRDVFPFENRTSQHLYLWAENQKEGDFQAMTQDRESGVKFRLHQRDDNASSLWFEQRAAQMRGKRVVDISDDYYAYIADVQGKPDATMYLEKSIGFATIKRMHRWGWPLRVVLLVRDPRDILLSVKSFNKKRNVQGFGADRLGETDLVRSYLNFFLTVRQMLKNNGIEFVEARYENLLNDPEQALAEVAQGLGLDASPSIIDQMVDAYGAQDENVRNHRTKSSGGALLRWKTEMMPGQIQELSAYNDSFETLGYKAC